MADTLYLVEGWTERIIDQLLADGSPQNLTGASVELVAYNANGPVSFVGLSGILDASLGKVYFDPDPLDLTKGRLKIRWKVTDGYGKVAFFPNAIKPDVWVVSESGEDF